MQWFMVLLLLLAIVVLVATLTSSARGWNTLGLYGQITTPLIGVVALGVGWYAVKKLF